MFAVAVILYNPSMIEIENIKTLSSFFDNTYIYDNSSCSSQKQFNTDSIKYYYNGVNDGLSIAYNKLISIAINDGHQWLMLLDQDSQPSETMISLMKEYASTIKSLSVAAVVPAIQYHYNEPADTTEHSVSWAINSGMMLCLKCLNEYGIHYDENLFLDRVDRDFSKQVELKGLLIIQVKDAVLKHCLGEMFHGHIIHSPIRNYYICKNRLYYNDKYYVYPLAKSLSLIQTVRHVIRIILSRNEIYNNLKMMVLAYKDYKQGLMGRTTRF